MNQKLVSIIIPVYNSEKYLKQCINSIRQQTYKNIEIIVIDDGSTDNSFNIISDLQKKDKRIKKFKIKNGGVSRARNYGIEKSNGNYITFIDSDDWVSNDFVKHAMQYIEEYNIDIVLGGTEKKYVTSNKKYHIKSKDIKIYQNIELKNVENNIIGYKTKETPELEKCFMSGSVCKIFKKNTLEGIKFDEYLKIGEDTIFNIETLRKSKSIGITPEIWYYYRMNENSATKKLNPKFNDEIKKTMKRLKELNVEKNPYYNRLIASLHGIFELYPFHNESSMNFFEQRKYLKNICNDIFWKSELHNIKSNEIMNFKFKVLLILCKKKLYTIIIFMYYVIKLIKNIRKKA